MVVLSHLISYWSVCVGVTIYATIYRFDPVVECYHTHIFCHKWSYMGLSENIVSPNPMLNHGRSWLIIVNHG